MRPKTFLLPILCSYALAMPLGRPTPLCALCCVRLPTGCATLIVNSFLPKAYYTLCYSSNTPTPRTRWHGPNNLASRTTDCPQKISNGTKPKLLTISPCPNCRLGKISPTLTRAITPTQQTPPITVLMSLSPNL